MGAFIDCVDKVSGKTFHAFLPATIADTFNIDSVQLHKFQALDEALIKSQQQLVTNNEKHLLRFNAGAVCLKEARNVTRKQLALANVGLGLNIPLATEIQHHVASYQDCVAIGCHDQSFSLATLTAMHAQINPDLGVKGQIRQSQNWIGGNSPFDAFYICPPAGEVPRLMAEVIEFINRDDIPASLQAAIAHLQMLITHPFGDGNGRVARALIEVILRRRGIVTNVAPPISLYRVGHQQDGYVDAIKAYERGEHQQLFDFWLKASLWALNLLEQQNSLRQSFEQNALAKLPLLSPVSPEFKIIKQLFDQPIVTTHSIARQLNCPVVTATALISKLQQAGILVQRRLRKPQGQMIWDAPQVFAHLKTIDQLIFSPQQER